MLPGSILSPGLQIAAMDSHKSACENEEEYAQKYGRVAHLSASGRSKWLVLTVVPVLIIFAVLLLRFLA
jgi:hypothetical protein